MSRAPLVPPVSAHRCSYRVCYADTDKMARVYYANYLIWFERARTELLRAAGLPYRDLEAAGCFLPVRRCEVRYHHYAEYDDEILLRSWITHLRHATATFVTLASQAADDRPIATGTVELVCVSAEGKPRPLPDHVLAALRPFLAESPD